MKCIIRNIFSAALFVLLLATVSSCKKETGSSNSVSGKYRMVYRPNSDTLPAYYIFNDDNTFIALLQGNQGGHTVRKGVFQYDGATVTMFDYSANVFLAVKLGDTLKLFRDPSTADNYFSNLILVKDASAPAESNWVEDVEVIKKLNEVSLNLRSISFLNSQFITCSDYESLLRRYDGVGGQSDYPLITAEDYFGIEGVAGNLWGITEGANVLKKLSTVSGAVLFTAAASPTQIHTLASDGTDIFCWGINQRRFQVYNIATDSYIAGGDFDEQIGDIAYRSGYIYASAYRYIYKIDPLTFKAVKTYRIKGVEIHNGIATDGTSFWVHVADEINEPGYFAKINLD